MSRYTRQDLYKLTIPILKDVGWNSHIGAIPSKWRKDEIIDALLDAQKNGTNLFMTPEARRRLGLLTGATTTRRPSPRTRSVVQSITRSPAKSFRNKKNVITKFNSLPADLYRLLGYYLPICDVVDLCRLNKRLNTIICNDQIFLNNFGRLRLSDDINNLPPTNTILRTIKKISVENAAKKGYDHFVEDNIAKTKDYNLLLYISVEHKNLNIVRYVLSVHEYTADQLDKALVMAAEVGSLDSVRYLMSVGADLHNHNDAAFIAACGSGNLELVQYLFSQSEELTGTAINIHAQNEKALLNAIAYADYDIVEYLINPDGQQGANIHFNNDQPLIEATKTGDIDIVRLLVENAADTRADNSLALRWAAYHRYLHLVKYLLANGADINAVNDDALRFAIINNDLRMVKYLVRHGANVHADNNVFLTTSQPHPNIQNYLLFAGDFDQQPITY